MAWSPVFLDNFNRADSTTVGNGWSQAVSGTAAYGIYSNTLRLYSGSASRSFAVQRDTTVGDARAVETTMVNTPNALYLYVGRRGAATLTTANSGYGYYASVSVFNGTANIYRANNGTSTSLASGTVTVTAGTVYRLEHDEDGSLRLYVNGALALTASDTTYMTATDTEAYGVGLVMLISSTAPRNDGRFDDFTIYEYESTVSYTVTYEEQGGSTVTDYSGAGPFTTPSSTRTGYRLDRWNTAADGSGTDYAVGGTYDLTADLTLYAIWVAVYTVTFDEQGGSAVDDVTYDTFSPPSSYRELWVLDGWNTSADGSGTRYELAETYTLTADLTLYAQWRQFGKVGIYLGGTTGLTDGTLEVPGDAVGLDLDAIGDVAVCHLRCASGWAATTTVLAPAHCEVSADGTTYGSTATLTVTAVNVPLYVKRTEASAEMTAPLSTLPHVYTIPAREVV